MSVVQCTTDNMCKLICNSKRLTQHIHDCIYCALVATMNVQIYTYKKTLPNLQTYAKQASYMDIR